MRIVTALGTWDDIDAMAADIDTDADVWTDDTDPDTIAAEWANDMRDAFRHYRGDTLAGARVIA